MPISPAFASISQDANTGGLKVIMNNWDDSTVVDVGPSTGTAPEKAGTYFQYVRESFNTGRQ